MARNRRSIHVGMLILVMLPLMIFPVICQSQQMLGPDAPAASEQHDYVVSVDDWALPRTGRRIIGMQGVRDAVASYDSRKGSRLVIHYPGGDNGTLMAYELREWLVALGVPARDIDLNKGLARADILLLETRN